MPSSLVSAFSRMKMSGAWRKREQAILNYKQPRFCLPMRCSSGDHALR